MLRKVLIVTLAVAVLLVLNAFVLPTQGFGPWMRTTFPFLDVSVVPATPVTPDYGSQSVPEGQFVSPEQMPADIVPQGGIQFRAFTKNGSTVTPVTDYVDVMRFWPVNGATIPDMGRISQLLPADSVLDLIQDESGISVTIPANADNLQNATALKNAFGALSLGYVLQCPNGVEFFSFNPPTSGQTLVRIHLYNWNVTPAQQHTTCN